MATDPSNTGDIHGTVAVALGTQHELHGEHGLEAGSFDAYGHGQHTTPPTDTNTPDGQTPPPKIPSTRILGRHASLAGMVYGSAVAHNRLDHLLGNIHHGDIVSRQRLDTWLKRSKKPANENDMPGWDTMIG